MLVELCHPDKNAQKDIEEEYKKKIRCKEDWLFLNKIKSATTNVKIAVIKIDKLYGFMAYPRVSWFFSSAGSNPISRPGAGLRIAFLQRCRQSVTNFPDHGLKSGKIRDLPA